MVQQSASGMADLFHALGDPTRLALFQQISRQETVVSELAKPLQISLSATLKHLRVLEKAGLAESRKVGRERKCRASCQPLEEMEQWISETRRAWSFRLDQLEVFLAKENKSER